MGLAALIGVANFKIYNKSFRILSGYLLYTFVQQLLAFWSNRVYETNAKIGHVYVIVSLLFYCWFLISCGLDRVMRRTILFSTFIGLIIVLMSIVFIQDIYNYPTFNLGIFSLVVTFQSFLFFKEILDKPSETGLMQNTRFLVVVSFMLFYMQCLFVFPTLAFVAKHFGHRVEYTYLIYCINFVFYLLLCVVLIMERRKQLK
jgi:hypothetical protein